MITISNANKQCFHNELSLVLTSLKRCIYISAVIIQRQNKSRWFVHKAMNSEYMHIHAYRKLNEEQHKFADAKRRRDSNNVIKEPRLVFMSHDCRLNPATGMSVKGK